MRPSVLSAVNIGLWGFLLFAGCTLITCVSDRHVPGGPNQDQVVYYGGIPPGVTLLSIATFAISFRPRPSVPILVVNLICLIGLMPFIVGYTDGV